MGVAAAADQAAAGGAPADADAETWDVLWCLDGWHEPRDRLDALLRQRAPWARLRTVEPGRTVAEQCAGAQVLIPTTGVVDAAAINAAAGLRLIAQPAAGTANIDLEAARARGVPVTFAPGVNAAATAEVALMLMLMLLRRADEARCGGRRAGSTGGAWQRPSRRTA